jgi:hypothetical protein
LKQRNRQIYAGLELITAFLVSWFALQHLADVIHPYEAISLCSALYLFVRAFDNLNEAKKQKALVQR